MRPGAAPIGSDTTSLLQAVPAGDREALDRLFELVYGELQGLARRQLGVRSPSATLQTTALVNETYIKLAGSSGWSAGDRAHFFALAGRAMRQIAIDHARRRLRERHGGGTQRLPIDDLEIAVEERAADLLALDAALGRLRTLDGELSQLVEWRYFAGCPLEEISAFTGLSVRTLKRRWRAARAFLYQELAPPEKEHERADP